MAPNLGFFALLFVLSITIFIPIFTFYIYKKNKVNFSKTRFKNLKKDSSQPSEIEDSINSKSSNNLNYYDSITKDYLKRILIPLSVAILICSVICQLFLIYSFLISDYSVKNVYQNSHHLKPLIYKIAGSWGNHEGSMLLLITVLASYNLAFALFSRLEASQKIIVIATQNFIIALFCAYTAIISNPFLRIFPSPIEGLGLNPILQDIGLALHPPMLYSGYLGFCIVFSITISGLLTNNFSNSIIKSLQNWLNFSYGFLTLGIALGSWWAYRELGWGGYWFWDPVENISLMPWLAGTALIHALKLAPTNNLMKIWSAFLAIIALILCLLGIFLTRSGILTSVHSFAIDAGRGFFVIALISIIGGFGLAVFGLKVNNLSDEQNLEKPKKQKKFWLILANNYFLILAILIVLIGTIYPILSRGIFNQFISIGATYYNQIFSILIIPFLIFLILTTNQKLKIKNSLIVILVLVSCLITFVGFCAKAPILLTQIITLFLAILASLLNIFSRQKISIIMAHGGFLMIIIGIITTSSFGIVKEVNLKQNQTIKIGRYKINFDRIDYVAGKNFIAREGIFSISKNNSSTKKLTQISKTTQEQNAENEFQQKNFDEFKPKITILKPQLRFYPVSDQTTNESSIYHGALGDLYLVIGNKDEAENYAVRAYYKPFIYFIWLGAIMIFVAVIGEIALNILLRKKFRS